MSETRRPPDFLVHDEGDLVAVAVRDLEAVPVAGSYLHGSGAISAELLEPIPLGHKFALADIAAGQDVIEYGHPVGVATTAIAKGAYVHVHNVRSARWQRSSIA